MGCVDDAAANKEASDGRVGNADFYLNFAAGVKMDNLATNVFSGNALKMDQVKTGGFKLIGIKLANKTTNEGGQSNADCGNLWQRFTAENIRTAIPGKISDDIYAVYFDYEGDHTQPFSFFIGCRVKADVRPPEGLDVLFIPTGNYFKFAAKGRIPDCIADTWKEIWSSEIDRHYRFDFEVYDERSRDWHHAEVDIYIS